VYLTVAVAPAFRVTELESKLAVDAVFNLVVSRIFGYAFSNAVEAGLSVKTPNDTIGDVADAPVVVVKLVLDSVGFK
jgi:hypothetical protein